MSGDNIDLSADNLTRRLTRFLQEAGEYAMSEFNQEIFQEAKYNETLVTAVDLAISKKFYDDFSDIAQSDDHLIIEEETVDRVPSDTIGDLGRFKTIWSLDPIDGTLPFALGMPLWGISLGVFKGDRPWIGAVYFPVIDELFISDGDLSHHIRRPFSDHSISTRLKADKPPAEGSKPLVLTQGHLTNTRQLERQYKALDLYTAAIMLCYMAKNCAVARIGRDGLWDLAGSWPVLKNAGYEIYDAETGEKLERVDPDHFTSDWYQKKNYIVTLPENLQGLLPLVKPGHIS